MTSLNDRDLQRHLHCEPDDELLDGQDAVLRHLDRLMAGRVTQAVDADQERVLRAAIEPGWQGAGSCASADPEAWFPEKAGHVNPAVRAICAQCPVRRSCLATAVLFAEDGTWAGTSIIDRWPAFRALRSGADSAQVLDEILNRQDASLGRRTHFKTQRWSGKPTSVGNVKQPHGALDASEGQDGDQLASAAGLTRPQLEQGPEAA